jgi:plastocyanin
MRRLPLAALICSLAVFGVGLTACGGDDNSSNDTASTPATTNTTTTETNTSGGGSAQTIKVAADPSGALKFEQSSLTGKAGKATFDFTNDSSTPHDFVLEEDGKEVAKTDVISGKTVSTSATLDAGGKYTYFCSVPGHRQAGMEGTLTVK